MIGNRGTIGKFKHNTDFGGRLGSQEAYLLSAGGFYPRFVAASSSTAVISDSSHTAFLAKASGNDATNTSVTDVTGKTITNYNTRTQGLTPYHPGGYSTYFDGSGDYLTLNPGADIAFGTGDFTVEAWVYHTTAPGANAIIDTRGGGTANWVLYRDTSNGGRIQWYNGSSNTYSTGDSKWSAQNTWLHVAYCRSGTTGYFFIDGELLNTQTDSTDYSTSSTELTIGARYSQDTSFFQGYIRDVRIVKGTALYTAAFAPATQPLTTTSQGATASEVKLLTCHAPFIGDGSTNARTVTSAGNVKTLRFSPYDIADGSEYSTSSHGASVYFDGNGDYLTLDANAGWNLANGAFTIEFWIYMDALSSDGFNTFLMPSDSSAGPDWQIDYKESGTLLRFIPYHSGSADTSTMVVTQELKIKQWYHIAVARSGNTLAMYLNGKQLQSASYSNTVDYDSTGTFFIGIRDQGETKDRPFNGYMSDLRIVKGSAVYTSAFTPPTSALADISGTSLLTCNTQPNVYDIGTGLRSIIYGNANASTDQYKYGTSSLHFDGGGDYIDFGANENLDLGTGPMTMEAWIKTSASSNDTFFRRIVMLDGPTLNSASNPQLMIDGPNGYGVAFANTGDLDIRDTVTGINVRDNSWHHIALTRNNTNAQLFVDGTYAGNQVIGTQAFSPNSGAPRPRLGNYNGASAQGDWNGYIQDVRISNGVCRYPFIPAAETLTSGTLTKALACHADSETTAVAGAGGETTLSVDKFGTPSASDFGPAPGMKSVYFDGSGDYLGIDLGSALGTSDFCVEGWVYSVRTGIGARGVFQISNDDTDYLTTGGAFVSFEHRNSGNGYEWQTFNAAAGQSDYDDTNSVTNRWYHFAMQRNGGTFKAFVGGQLIGSNSNTRDYSDARYLAIGGYYSAGSEWMGYISNLRVSVGSGSNFYANSFTVPAAELTS